MSLGPPEALPADPSGSPDECEKPVPRNVRNMLIPNELQPSFVPAPGAIDHLPARNSNRLHPLEPNEDVSGGTGKQSRLYAITPVSVLTQSSG
jgi:hypothetical protein